MIGDRLLRVAHHAFVIVVVVAAAIALSAQTVVDPQFVEFTPSPDHNTLATDGTPLVQRYSLSFYPVGSSVAFDTMDLGKPTPSAGMIRVDFLPLRNNVPTPGVTYEARVAAIGPGGSTASAVSNGFSFQGACAPTLNATSRSVTAAATTGSVGVTAGTGCTWSAVSNASWLTLTGPTSGSGNGTVPYSVAANATTSARTGTLTVAGQTYTVNQAALACSYTLSSASQSVAAGGGTGSTNVTAPAGCAWTGVSNNAPWLTVTSGASGTGNGTVAFNATANPNTSPRTGTITIGGQTFSVNQAALACSYTLSSASQAVVAGGGTGSTNVTAPTGCAWTGVSNNTSWLTVTSGASGTGSGTVAFNASSNPNTSPRTGTITIGGQTFSVNQAALACSYTLSSASQAVGAGGGTGSTNVTAAAGCAWTGVSNNALWLTVTSGASGTGNGTVAFNATANPNTSPRTGTITIGGQTFSVNQAALACSYTLSSASQAVGAGGGTGSTNVTAAAGCAWTGVSNNAPWLTVTSGASGTGNGTVAFNATANPNTSPRTGTLTIGGQTFTVNQAALACSYTLSSASQAVAAGGGTGSTNVTAPAGCAWTGVSNNTPWLTVTSGASGTGSGTVAFNASSNPNTSPRTGTITIGGQTFSVNQAALACSYTLSSASQAVVAGGGTGSTNVTAPTGCAWTGVSNNTSWLTVTSGASGTGSGTVAFSATSNPNTSARTGTITIGGQTFTVNQAAAGCSYALVPASQSVPAAGGTGSTQVTTLAGCAWTGVSNNTPWLAVTSGASGNGGGTVGFSVSANPNGTQRNGTLTIGGQTFTVTQAPAACTYTLSSASQAVAAGGGTGSTNVTAPTGCAWTGVSNNTPWLTVTSGANGSGNGTVAFSATANPNGTPRTGTLTIGGQTFSVNQAAVGCTYALSPASQSVLAGGGTGSTSVTTQAGCAWTGASNDTSWLTVTSGASGTGAGTVAFSAAVNANTTQRTGTLTIGGQTFSVTQAGAPCTYSVSPVSQSVLAVGGTGSTSVIAATGCAWTAVSNNTSWLTVTSGASGSGNGTVAFAAAINGSAAPRTGTLTIAGQTFTVTQAGPTCTYSLSPTSQSVVAGGSTGSTSVTAPVGCAWTAVSNDATWLTVTNGATGSGNGSVSFSAASNVTVSPRTGTLTIGGQTFTVNQNSTSCAFSISPTSQSVPAAGDSGSATVTATTGCSWTTVSNATWITVTAGATGSGDGSASFTVAPSTLAAVRTGTLTIAGRGFTVTQAANTCSYVLAPASTTLTSAGGTGSIGVTAASGCTWVASTNQAWITASGSGSASGSASYTVQPNTGGSRVGAVSIGTQVFTVTQSAGTTGCTFSISPTSASVASSGGSGSTTVTAPAGCSWTGVSNNAPWLTLTSGATGTGSGSASFNAAPNTATSPRTGTLTVAGQTFTVTQAAAGCTFSISPASQSVPAAGGNVSTAVTTSAGCSWTVVNGTAWITVTGGSGSGSGSASFTVAPSTSTFARTGTLTIAGRVFTVTQAANTCSYTLTPTSATLTPAGGTGSVTVATASGCAWAATTNQSWITVSGTGTASGSVSYTVQPNTSGSARTGAISIGTQVFTVIQATPPVAPGGLRLIGGD